MTLWTNPTGENSIQAKWEIGKTAPANMISLWEQIQMWKWPPAEIWNGRRTCLVIQLGNCDIFRTLFCRICILRHGWGQFTITCHRCSAIFLQDQPLFSNFPLFEVLETQLTFKSVGEPDYSKGHEYPSALTFKFHDEEDDWMIIWWWQIHVLGSHGFSRIPKVHFSDLARCIFQMKQDVFLRCSKMYFSDMINFEAQLRFGNERSYLGPNTFAPKLTRLRHLPSFCRLTSVCKLYFLVSWRPGRFC